MKISPNLPVYFLPGDSVGLSDICDEFLKIPLPVDCMLSLKSPLCVNECSALGTCEKLSLTSSEQAQAVPASVQIVLLLL